MIDLKEALTRKIGPLPVIAWGGVIGGGYLVYRAVTGGGGGGSASSPAEVSFDGGEPFEDFAPSVPVGSGETPLPLPSWMTTPPAWYTTPPATSPVIPKPPIRRPTLPTAPTGADRSIFPVPVASPIRRAITAPIKAAPAPTKPVSKRTVGDARTVLVKPTIVRTATGTKKAIGKVRSSAPKIPRPKIRPRGAVSSTRSDAPRRVATPISPTRLRAS